MKVLYVVIDEDEIVERAGSVNDPAHIPAGGVAALSDGITYAGPLDVGALSRCYLSDGQLLPRPPSAQPMQSGNTVTIPPCPAGTVIHVYDQTGKEQMAEIVADTDGWTDAIEFADPGTYAIEVHEPLPALPSILIVEV